jgi:sodium--glutamate symport carrier gltS
VLALKSAFLVVPLVGAFVIDFTNALITLPGELAELSAKSV